VRSLVDLVAFNANDRTFVFEIRSEPLLDIAAISKVTARTADEDQ
jgi:hypothetical protein